MQDALVAMFVLLVSLGCIRACAGSRQLSDMPQHSVFFLSSLVTEIGTLKRRIKKVSAVWIWLGTQTQSQMFMSI